MLSADDPLLSAPQTWVTDPNVRPDGVDPVVHLAEAVSDYFGFNAVAIPAFGRDGMATVPPDEHVLDHLARTHDLVDEQEALIRPAADTVYVTPKPLAECDLCGAAARYDTYFANPSGEPVGGYGCEDCVRARGDHTLGAGHSVYLMTFDEVSTPVREVVAEICRRQHRELIGDWPASQ